MTKKLNKKSNYEKIALVTGSAGFIGSNLIGYLLSKNFHVIGVDNFRMGKKFIKDRLTIKTFYLKLDLTEKKFMNLSKYKTRYSFSYGYECRC